MARKKPSKRSAPKPASPHPTGSTAPARAKDDPPSMPTDYRMGLVLFVLLELGIYWAMTKSDAPWFHNEAFAPWRNAFLAATAVLWLGIVSLWIAGRRSRRFGWLILLSIVWLLVLAGRIVPAFLIAASALPAFLTIFIGQLGCALMIPAALRERRKAAA